MPRLFLSLRLGRRLAQDLVLHRLGTPRRRSRSRTRSSSLRTSEAPTTGSFDPTAMAPPSSINRRHRNRRFAAPPFRLATAETASPGTRLSPMMRSFSRSGQYRRRATPVITSTRRMSSSGMSMSPSTGLSLPWSCRTVRAKRGAVHHLGAQPEKRRAVSVPRDSVRLPDWPEGHMPWTETARLEHDRRGGRYASDPTNRERAPIGPFMPSPRRIGRPRTTDLREVMNAILHMAGLPPEKWSSLK